MSPYLPFQGQQPSVADEIPQYHEGLLEVKFRTDAGPLAAMTALGGPPVLTRAAAATSPGLGALLAFERSGLIRRVIPVDDGASAAGGETPMLATVAAAAYPTTPDPNAGVSLVELYRDQDAAQLEADLRRDPTVESVARVPVRYLLAKKPVKKAGAGAVPAAAAPAPSALWNLTRIRWAEARQKPGFVDATNIKVAVLDTGIDTGHPDRPANIAAYEFAHPTNPNASSNRDIIGHGTHVSGTIAAGINNGIGINGICNCALHMLKIFDDIPDWYPRQNQFAYFVEPAMYLRALSRCLTLGVNVINLSIGGGGPPSPQESQRFNALLQANTTIVAAMGNEGSTAPSYPAAIPGVIAVGATSINDVRANFSNMGAHISVVAPGVGIWSTLPTYPGNTGYLPRPTFPPQPDFNRPIPRDTDYAAWQGTSMACPHVTAAVALLLAKNGAMTPAAVKQKLQAAAVKVPAMAGQNFTQEYGFGRLDLVKLL